MRVRRTLAALIAFGVAATGPMGPPGTAGAAPVPADPAAATAPDAAGPTGPEAVPDAVPGAGGLPVAGHRHEVTYDRYSLKLDGRRILVQSAEFHYFRLPSPDLWRDILEKEKAAGFNAISVYFDWAYHSPRAGVYDFTGVRDVDRLLREAERVGLWVIARPGPYINAETTGGGFPAWLKQVPGRARSSDPGYTAAYRDWLAHIDPIIARHQVTRGGSVLLYNVENEYAVNTDPAYMQDLQDTARSHGVDVPITTNVCCDAADWVSTWGAGPGAVQIPGVDDYPQSFDCGHADEVWGPWGEGVTERIRDDAPVFAAEYQAGAIDLDNAGYAACRELTGPAYMRFFHKNNTITSGATAFSYYMGFGGTNWGWLGQPNDVYTSYDYGAAITEGRQLTAKYDEFKRQGYFLRTLTPLTRTDPAAGPAVDNAALSTAARVNPDTHTQFVLLRHADAAADTDDAGTLDWATPDGRYRVPVRLTGRDAKILVAGYDLGGQRLVLSSSEIMTQVAAGGRDVALLYGDEGRPGTTVLRYRSRPRVTVLAGDVAATYDPDRGDLRLDYTHRGLARVLVTGGGRRPLTLLLGTPDTAAAFWQVDTASGPLLVRGTSLVRSATAGAGAVQLRADTGAAGEVEVFGPARRLTVNGQPVPVRATRSGSVQGRLPGPAPVSLPALDGWRTRTGAPEAAADFDDSDWTVADHTSTLSPIPPVTLPVLYSDDYGYHSGSVWYRGHFTATGEETEVKLNAVTGRRGNYLVWVNGRYLGAAAGGTQADAGPPANPDPGPGTFALPAGLLRPGTPATIAVLVQNMGQNDDWTAEEIRFRQPRGLVGAAVTSGTGDSGTGSGTGSGSGSGTAIRWRIQGAAGGEDLTDPVRGPLNTGGLYGERTGWTLPGYPDRSWPPAGTPGGVLAGAPVSTGVNWFRTSFRLDLPRHQDSSVALRFGAAPPAGYRVLLYLNGWNLGQYGADIGPQTDFVLPAGLLREHGGNTLALAVVADQPGRMPPPAWSYSARSAAGCRSATYPLRGSDLGPDPIRGPGRR
ncbi:beta-galactosidase [Plantactinospora sp. KBS50]|uniref:beta-galactosidase n=1 Tax=Plantactinospora sp. KBS50 TaxID=2024580 RepID=UPI001E3971CF|nr:beta-galactosidase [Plantactinospora sp. KBS50]